MRKLIVIALLLAATACYPKKVHAADDFSARIDLIGAEIFSIDTSHSSFGFSIGFLGLTKVHGTFKDYRATILYDDRHPERSSVTVIIDAASIDTFNKGRDEDLKTEKFFDVAKYPEITFQSTSIEKKGADSYLMNGNLTIKGVAKPVAIPLTRTVPRGPDSAWGNIRIGGAGKVVVKRKDFNLLGNEFWGDKTLSDEVEITLDILGNRFNFDRFGWQSKDKPSIGEVVFKTAETSGGAAAAAQYRELKATKADDYNFAPGQLGVAVNRLMQRRKYDDALELLAAGREAFPNESGFYARSGEAYAAKGKRDDAIRMYEKAAQLNPSGTESTEMLRRLKKTAS